MISSNQYKFLILGSIAGGFMKQYDKPQTKVSSKLFKILKKSTRKIYESNKEEYLSFVKVMDVVWKEYLNTIHEKLEIMNLVTYALMYESDVMKRFGVSEKLTESFCTVRNDDIDLGIELKSKEVSQFLIDIMYGKYELVKPKKINLRMIKNKVRNELILEGKIK